MRWRAASRRGSAAAGTSLAQIDTALSSAVDSLNTSLGYVPATTSWLLSRHTVAHLLALRGSGGAPAYPSLNTSAPTLLGLPVLTSSASATTGLLVSPGAILLGENDVVEIERSTVASLEMSSQPSGDALTPTATATVSSWQADMAAIKATLLTQYAGAAQGVVKVAGLSF